MVIAASFNQTDNFESLFTLFAWYSSVIHGRQEMKDMLVDMHSSANHHLMARANYDVGAHSYLEITQYLQNLGLIEESFNKGNAQQNKQGNSKPKAHKAHKHQK
jgi:hypothetical protein